FCNGFFHLVNAAPINATAGKAYTSKPRERPNRKSVIRWMEGAASACRSSLVSASQLSVGGAELGVEIQRASDAAPGGKASRLIPQTTNSPAPKMRINFAI